MKVRPAKDPDRNEKIIAMARAGFSYGLIVERVPGVTRNMIAGIVGRAKRKGILPTKLSSSRKLRGSEHSMGGALKPRAPAPKADENPGETVIPSERAPKPQPARASQADENPAPARISSGAGVAPAIAGVIPNPAPAPVTRGNCRYPIGDPRQPGFRFCEAPAQLGSSYCPTHHAVCWTRATKPKPVDYEGHYGQRRHAAR